MQTLTDEADVQFDDLHPFLGYEDALPETKLPSDAELLISNQAEKFVRLIVLNGKLPSDAYMQAFATEDEYGNLIKPDVPSYKAKQLLKLPEVQSRIKEMRDEVVEWGKTSFEEVEMNLRSIALDAHAKHSDRINATKALSTLRGFDQQPDIGALAGAVINIALPWVPKIVGHGSVIPLDAPVSD